MKDDTTEIHFTYDGLGNRISKTTLPENKTTVYTRDAQGNVLAVYETNETDATNISDEKNIFLKEHHIYGSSRLGLQESNITLLPSNTPSDSEEAIIKNEIGDKRYELSNHLGNVLSVITDKIPIFTAGSLNYYKPDVVAFNDYYPGGMLLPNRHGSSDSYRYGFGGQEKDDEIKGEGNSYNYTFRHYDPRLMRFFATDPLEYKFPWWSPYQYAGNSPILYQDLEGMEPSKPELFWNRLDKAAEKKLFGEDIARTVVFKTVGMHKLHGDFFDELLPSTMYVARTYSENEVHNYYYNNSKHKWIEFDPTDIGASADEVSTFAVYTIGGTLAFVGAIELFGLTALAKEGGEFIFETVTGIPVILDPIDLIEGAIKKGAFKGVRKGLKDFESKRVAEYLSDGSLVKRIKENSIDKLPDFTIDGLKVEFKALTKTLLNPNTAVEQLKKATKKIGVDIIDLDIRIPKGSLDDARDIYKRFKGTDKGKAFKGKVRIATQDGVVEFGVKKL